jgi:hypothetical protein
MGTAEPLGKQAKKMVVAVETTTCGISRAISKILCMPKQSKIQKIQTAKKTKYREKIRKIIITGLSLVLRKKLYFKNTGTEGSVFYCIFSNTTGKSLYWHAQQKYKKDKALVS